MAKMLNVFTSDTYSVAQLVATKPTQASRTLF